MAFHNFKLLKFVILLFTSHKWLLFSISRFIHHAFISFETNTEFHIAYGFQGFHLSKNFTFISQVQVFFIFICESFTKNGKLKLWFELYSKSSLVFFINIWLNE